MGPRGNLLHAQTAWLAIIDGVCLILSVVAGVFLRDWIGRQGFLGFDSTGFSPLEYFSGHLDGWIYFCGSIILANFIAGSYGVQVTTSKFNLVVNWFFAMAVALLVLSITSYAWFEQLLGRGVLFIAVVFYAGLSLVVKAVFYLVILRSDFLICRTVVLGASKDARRVREIVEKRHVIPRHRICAYLVCSDCFGSSKECGNQAGKDSSDGVPVLHVTVHSLEQTITSLGANLVVTALGHQDMGKACYAALRRLRFSGVEVADTLTVAEHYGGRIPLDLIDDTWLMQASLQPSLAVVGRFKRILDLFVTILFLPLWTLIGLLVALLIKISAPRYPVLFVQERLGRFGQVFHIYKFRTMKPARGGEKAEWAGKADTRITRLGRVLRKFRLDEIPQLVNVLKGDMSLVGPRPEQPALADEIEKSIPHYRERENVLPGLSGWAQVQYPYTDNVEDAARKLEFDFYYMKNLSLRLDFQIILRTLRIVILGKEREV